MLFTVTEGWAIVATTVSLVVLGTIYVQLEKRAHAWFYERSRTKARQLFIDAEFQYNNEQRVSGLHPTVR